MKWDAIQFFREDEFKCKCCGQLVLDETLPMALDQLRQLAGRPISVNCGYRCAKHNAEVGGEKNSQHMLGKAADIVIEGMTPQQMYHLALMVPEFREGGLGIYPDQRFLHVDVRGTKARWARKGGRMVAVSEVLA